MTQHTHILTVEIGDTEVQVECEFTRDPICPATGPTYASGGEPESGGAIDISEATVLYQGKRHPCPHWLLDIINSDEDLRDQLSATVTDEDDGPDPDAAYDAMRDERDAA